MVAGISGVQIGPGATLLTRMPRSPSSCARLAAKLAMAALVAAYGASVGDRHVGVHRGTADDRGTGRHVRHRRLGQVEHRRDVGGEGVLPLLVGNLLQRLAGHLVGGVVDQDVDLAERLERGGDDLAAVRGVRDIAVDQHGLAAGLLHQRGGVLGVVVLVEVGDQHVGALAGVGDRHRPSDAAVAAGDHRGLAGQLAGSAIAVLAAVRPGSHRGLGTWDVLLLFWLAHCQRLSAPCVALLRVRLGLSPALLRAYPVAG